MAKQLSRPKRWFQAVSQGQDTIQEMAQILNDIDGKVDKETIKRWDELNAQLSTHLQELEDLKSEYEDWQSSLPENLQSGDLASKLKDVVSLSFDTDELDSLEPKMDEEDIAELGTELETRETMSIFRVKVIKELETRDEQLIEAENVDLPRGFGRD